MCSIWLYDCSTWAKLLTLERAEMYWFSMAFLPDGTFVSGASNGNVLVWDGVKTEPTLVLPAEHGVWSLAATKTVFSAGVYASGKSPPPRSWLMHRACETKQGEGRGL